MSFEVAHVDPCCPRAACAWFPALCNVPDGCRVGTGRTLPASACGNWTISLLANATGDRRHPLRAPRRLRLGAPARDFPPSETVHRWFLRVSRSGTLARLAHALTTADRERVDRNA